MPQARRLAAIMFTGIAGYTAMMQVNETAAAAMLLRYRGVFHDEVMQYYGDGTLKYF